MDNLTGIIFGRLTALERVVKPGNKRTFWKCQCSCGKTAVVNAGNLKNGNTSSCGCFVSDKLREVATTHGMSKTPTYESWIYMHRRCAKSNKNYSDRGISVSDSWKIFSNFLIDMGEKPKGATLERIDVNGNYGPGNCKWATWKEQANNKRNSRFIEYKGKKQTLSMWSDELKISYAVLQARLDRLKWPVEKAFETPINSYLLINRQPNKGA